MCRDTFPQGVVVGGAHGQHRDGGHPPTLATPPCVRVRTRRFELVTLTPIDQRWKSEQFEVSVGKPNRESFLARPRYQGPRPLPAVLLASRGRTYPVGILPPSSFLDSRRSFRIK